MSRLIRFYAKTSDRFNCDIIEDGKRVNEETYDGYPPFFLGDGDGISLVVDLDTGQIQNWVKPSDDQIQRLIGDEDGIH